MNSAVASYPAVCPRCDVTAGMPFRAQTMRDGGMSVDLRCRQCQHEWQLKVPPGGILVTPKPDRRQDSVPAKDD